MTYIVKFKKWNAQTIESIINKSVWFSTVHEFNDMNEYRYIARNEQIGDELRKIITSALRNAKFISRLEKLVRDRGSKYTICSLKKYINGEMDGQKFIYEFPNFLVENLAYASVGIFCASDLSVFKDDSAQIMFAHYADNLSGVALVYDTAAPYGKIEYEDRLACVKHDIIFSWAKGQFNIGDMEVFLIKSPSWRYEHEKRFFATPSEHRDAFNLKAILYTSRFSGDEDTLNSMNAKMYDGKLIIKKIYASYEVNEKHFRVASENINVCEFFVREGWLDKKYCDCME